MAYVVVPKEAGADRAAVWVACDEASPPQRCELVHPGGRTPLPPGAWAAWHRAEEARRLHHQLVELGGLSPRTSGGLALEVAGRTVARGRLTTLPRRLPSLGERPLTFLLGSCYCAARDPSGRVERAYRRLPAAFSPDFKILCGDQVYLDSPWIRFLLESRSEAEMRACFLERYWSTWAGRGLPGLRLLLADGANVFAADDHEFWNNAPNRSAHLRDTWTQASRERWARSARSLYETFQTPQTSLGFDVPPLSFHVADTRLNRDAGEKRFMSDADLARLVDWVRRLTGPGVLVLGQLVFARRAGPLGHLRDFGLPDYEQFQVLAAALQAAPHSVLVLSGDVHFRRIAWTRPGPSHEVFELVSSPLTLVDDRARGDWSPAPDRFPADEVHGLPRHPVETAAGFRGSDDHFLVIQCHAVGSRVHVAVHDFAVNGEAGGPSVSTPRIRLRLR